MPELAARVYGAIPGPEDDRRVYVGRTTDEMLDAVMADAARGLLDPKRAAAAVAQFTRADPGTERGLARMLVDLCGPEHQTPAEE